MALQYERGRAPFWTYLRTNDNKIMIFIFIDIIMYINILIAWVTFNF